MGRSPVAASVVGLAVGVLLLLRLVCCYWDAVYPLWVSSHEAPSLSCLFSFPFLLDSIHRPYQLHGCDEFFGVEALLLCNALWHQLILVLLSWCAVGFVGAFVAS